MKKIFKFKYNNRTKHYALILYEINNKYIYLTLTHSSKQQKRNNLKLLKNPNSKDSKVAYLIKNIYIDKRNVFYRKYNERLVLGQEDELRINEYLKTKERKIQMIEIEEKLQEYLKSHNLKESDFNGNEKAEIFNGLQQNLDVSPYADPKFNWRQMREIREKLLKEQEELKNKKEEKHSLRM